MSGGFGLFQYVATFFLVITMGSVAFFLYAFSFLEHRPKYECIDETSRQWVTCTNNDFCLFDLHDGDGEFAPGK